MQITIYGIKGNETDYAKTFTVKTAYPDGSYDFTTGHYFHEGFDRQGGDLYTARNRRVARYAYGEKK